MPDRKLKYIETVIKFGSILKAAESLYITPSALGKYIQKIENDLGVPLFDRIGKRFVLSYAGERYLAWQRRLNVIYEDMMSEMKDIASADVGRIRVGIQHVLAEKFVYDILPNFYERYPKVAIELVQRPPHKLHDLLEECLLDIALVPDVGLNSHFTKIWLTNIHKVAVVPAKHPAVGEAAFKPGFKYPWIDLTLLKDERFLVPSQTIDMFSTWGTISDQYGFTPYCVRQTDILNSALFKGIKQGLGVTLCYDLFTWTDHIDPDIKALSFGEKEQVNDFILAFHKNHYIDHATQYFIDLCRGIS